MELQFPVRREALKRTKRVVPLDTNSLWADCWPTCEPGAAVGTTRDSAGAEDLHLFTHLARLLIGRLVSISVLDVQKGWASSSGPLSLSFSPVAIVSLAVVAMIPSVTIIALRSNPHWSSSALCPQATPRATSVGRILLVRQRAVLIGNSTLFPTNQRIHHARLAQ